MDTQRRFYPELLLKGFYKLSIEERLHRLKKLCHLSDQDLALLKSSSIPTYYGEHWIENMIGYFPIPFGIATYFRIDYQDFLIPMVIEETSVIAAASATAKWIRTQGVLSTKIHNWKIIGQIQFPQIKEVEKVASILKRSQSFLLQKANAFVPQLQKRGGGIEEIQIRILTTQDLPYPMLVLHLLCNPCDAMGANLINQVCEGLKPTLEQLTGTPIGLCILSNLMDTRLTEAQVVLQNIDPAIGIPIENASRFAETDPYRAATHNKGILNGIDAVFLATGNDWRAMEAGAHAYASKTGAYRPLSTWRYFEEKEQLQGSLLLPLPIGTVGGVTQSHPFARLAMKILHVHQAKDLARICAAVGLVQNLGALKALSGKGIVQGHMKLHAANLALAVGASREEIPSLCTELQKALRKKHHIDFSCAQNILHHLRIRKQSVASV